MKHKRNLNKVFIACLGVVELLLFLGILFTIMEGTGDERSLLVYDMIAISLVLLWVGVLIGFFAWAIYFYNINLGLTNEDWDTIKATRKKMLDEVGGEFKKLTTEQQKQYSAMGRDENPHATQTFGLPPGTVRGTIAITLLFGGIALLLFSMGLDSEVEQSKFIQDNFVFFKDAFLMMIAFYFGSSSLKYLKKDNDNNSRHTEVPAGGGGGNQSGNNGNQGGGNGAHTHDGSHTHGNQGGGQGGGGNGAAPAPTGNPSAARAALNNVDDDGDDDPTAPAGLVVSLQRMGEQDGQTLGELTVDKDGKQAYQCKTLELPWQDSAKKPCYIPQGTYTVTKDTSSTLGKVFRFAEVAGQKNILIQSGVSKDDAPGCILVGASFADVTGDGLMDVTSSQQTMKELYDALPDSFQINIG